ncbi:MAG: thrombospondin type 3 repeat-containing protein, partial [Chloroflexi bacterium]|nr:thrombospondin type 3 repeat-containing protein [Chloroflexota bacterium]
MNRRLKYSLFTLVLLTIALILGTGMVLADSTLVEPFNYPNFAQVSSFTLHSPYIVYSANSSFNANSTGSALQVRGNNTTVTISTSVAAKSFSMTFGSCNRSQNISIQVRVNGSLTNVGSCSSNGSLSYSANNFDRIVITTNHPFASVNINQLSVTFGDSDNDGVSNHVDQCPGTPAGATVNAQGCPSDSDGDGVLDGLDQCPATPAGATVNVQGCPSDSDGDGVLDGLDQCPGTPAGATVNVQGCPSDSDGDGVLDGLDQCPGTPAGATVNVQGCPSDSDGDGVL